MNPLPRHAIFSLLAIAVLACAFGLAKPVSGRAGGDAAPVWVTQKPAGFRDWTVISVAHEEGKLNSIGAALGNDIAIKAYRENKPAFPDGAIIAALHYKFVPSDANNKVFGQAQSFVAGAPTNTQFMIKDATKYAATGGWGYGHFNADGSLGTEAAMRTCFPCHQQAAHDFVFTQYAP
jgi:Cytochrome P460